MIIIMVIWIKLAFIYFLLTKNVGWSYGAPLQNCCLLGFISFNQPHGICLSCLSSSDLAWSMRECLTGVGLFCMDTLSCIHWVGRLQWLSACCMELRSCPVFLLFSSCLFYNLFLVVGMVTRLILPYYLPTLWCSTSCSAPTVLYTTRYS